jgi:glycosyltransferase involved in cell wall biosynthesis
MSHKKPTITVMMPVFNASKYLAESLQSVFAQDCNGFEIVLIDDASSDRSCEMAEQFGRDSRLRLYRNPAREGIVATRNKILSLARGDWIVPHDADDIMMPGRLKAQQEILFKRPALGGVFGLAIMLWGKKKFDFFGCRDRDLNGKLTQGIVNTIPDDFHHGTSMTSRELMIKAGGYDSLLSQGEDLRLFRRLFSMAPFYFHRRFCLIYRKHSRSSSATYVRTRTRFLKQLFSRGARKRGWRIKINKVTMSLDACDPSSQKLLLWHFNLYATNNRKGNRTIWRPSGAIDELMKLLGEKFFKKGLVLIRAALLSKHGKGALIFFDAPQTDGTALLSFVNKGYVYHSSEICLLELRHEELRSKECIDPLVIDSLKAVKAHTLWNPIIGKRYLAMDLFKIGSLGGSCVISKMGVL